MDGFYIDSDIAKASTIPSAFYKSQNYFELSKEKIFAKTWQLCIASDDVRIPGQIFPFILLPGMLDEPVLFVRDIDDVLHCLSNVCTHRGNLLINDPCIAQQLKCRYHGRRFKLCGEFMHMPEFEQTQNFPSEKDSLSKIPFAQFHQFIFAAIAPAIPFKEAYDEMIARLAWFPFEKLQFNPNRSRDYLIKSHWALYCENYLEGLHIPFVHQSLRSVIDYGSYTTEIFRYANLQIAFANDGEEGFELPSDAKDFGKQVAAYYFWIFPNTMFNFYPWGCSVNIVKPLSPMLTKVSFLTYILDETKINSGAGAELDKVEREDEAVVETVQKGISSRFYHSGRYSPTREQGTHHFHRLLCEFLNA